MKKLFLMAAFAGLLVSTANANTKGDDKDKKAKKECKAGDKKECAKGDKSCCKKKTQEAPAPAAAPEKK